MNGNQINIKKIINHWESTSDNDYQTMENLFNSKDYHWSLFMGHLVIEKLLKAKVVKDTNKHPPYSHDLRKLILKTKLKPSQEAEKWLDNITSFNLNARYDDYKKEFYKKCDINYTRLWIKNIKILRQWIKREL